jgi:hypothetical protein
MKYNQLRSKLQTGDIVLFSGKGGISAGIKWATVSKWSHVGMMYCVPEHDLILLWESTTLCDIRDIETGVETQGVQLVPFSERVRRYGGDVAVRLLTVQRTPKMLQTLHDFRKEMKGRPYEQDKVELIKAAWDGPFGENQEDLSSLFCSELVAEAYQRMRLLPDGKKDKPSNEYTPADFSEAAKLQLLTGKLGKETAVTL